jgi:2-succinyl-5-enolpyruvyl-6-hydroxy-3-cyclohexene-1-carboxylate synthase
MVIGDAPSSCVETAWSAAERGGWPVIAEPQSRHRATGVSCGPLVAGSRAWVSRHAPERVLVVGRPTLSRQISWLVSGAVAPVDVVTAGPRWPDAAHAARQVHREPDLRLFAPSSAAATPLLAAWTAAGEQARTVVGRVLDDDVAGERLPSGIAAVREVLRAVPQAAVLFLGSSSVIRDVDLLAEQLPARVLTNRGVGGIDGSVSTAVGMALVHDTPAFAIMGDLTFLHDANGLVIGPSEPRPDLCIVVVNDDGGGIFALLEQGAPEHAAVFERVFGTPHGVDIEAMCAATGTPYERVELEKLAAAVSAQPGLRVVEVRVDRHRHRHLHARLRTAVAAAIG